jgi:hypothetical protein
MADDIMFIFIRVWFGWWVDKTLPNPTFLFVIDDRLIARF